MEKHSLKKNAIFNILKTIMSMFFPVITFPYATHILLPEGIGKVNFANSIISYFSIIASLGITTYGIREAAKIKNDKLQLSKFVKELLTINFISTLIAYILFFISLFLIPKFHEYKILLCLCSSTMLLSTIGIDWLYGAIEEYQYIAIRSVFFQFLSLLFLFLFVHTKDDYIIYAAISVFSSAGSNICNLIHSRRYINFSFHCKLDLKKHIKPVLILFASSLAISVFTILDTSMLGFMKNDLEVGYYSAASKIIRMVRDLFPAVFTVLLARLSVYAMDKDKTNFIALVDKTLNFILCFSLPITAGLLILMDPLILLFCGNQFQPAIMTGRILAPLVIISSCSGFLGGQIMISLNKEKTYLICVISASILDIFFNLLLIPRFGSFGAGLATLITEFLLFVTYLFLSRKLIKQMNLLKPFFQYLISSLFMSLGVYFLSLLFNNQLLKLIIPTLFGILIYAFTLYIFKNVFFLSLIKIIHKKINTPAIIKEN